MIAAFELLLLLMVGVYGQKCLLNGTKCHSFSKSCVDDYCFPRIIWAYWSEEQLPEFVAEIIENNRKSVGNFTYCILGPTNITEYLDINMSDSNFTNLKLSQQGDYIRIRLLEKYGGIWTDISTFLNSESEIEWFVSESLSSRSQFTSFEFNWENVKLEFSFIGAPENSSFMPKFRKEVEMVLSKGQEQYSDETCRRLLLEGVKVPEVICDPYYFIDLTFLSAYSDRSTAKSSILLLPEKRSNYRLFAECSYNGACVIQRYLQDAAVRKYPFIKLQGNARRWLGEYMKQLREKNAGRIQEMDEELRKYTGK